ncbi:uncharacterized protein LOC120581935 [Pteropus medius]|uniref:uncharacterized protein LOC120581935 n=1 Tax=Pteropus vampyrus TaxID=132908 RepID=UPI00196A64A2|nr:uncharacterized protein LOC120581935 [Pteropus giganteus]
MDGDGGHSGFFAWDEGGDRGCREGPALATEIYKLELLRPCLQGCHLVVTRPCQNSLPPGSHGGGVVSILDSGDPCGLLPVPGLLVRDRNSGQAGPTLWPVVSPKAILAIRDSWVLQYEGSKCLCVPHWMTVDESWPAAKQGVPPDLTLGFLPGPFPKPPCQCHLPRSLFLGHACLSFGSRKEGAQGGLLEDLQANHRPRISYGPASGSAPAQSRAWLAPSPPPSRPAVRARSPERRRPQKLGTADPRATRRVPAAGA